MAKVISLNRAFQYGLLFLLSLVALGGGPRLSEHFLASPSLAMRWLGVVVTVASPLPWLALVVMGIGTWDEFQRHIALVGTAIAFVGELLFYMVFYAMRDARLIGPTVYIPYLTATLLIWLASVGVAALYYRTRA
jgi:hypothetical protein